MDNLCRFKYAKSDSERSRKTSRQISLGMLNIVILEQGLSCEESILHVF